VMFSVDNFPAKLNQEILFSL